MPKVSVIIPTLFRAKYCVRSVEDLMVQDYPDFEVIVVEQEVSSPEVAALPGRFPGRVQYFFEKISTGPRNKNVGASNAKGEIFLFLDDDSRFPVDFISKSVAVLMSDPSFGVVSAKILQPREPLKLEKEGVVGIVRPYGKIITNYGSNTRTFMDTAHGCSMYRAEAFKKAGGFEERYDGNAMREETDLSMRVGRAGYKLVFDPSIEFVHIKAPMGGTRRKPDRMEWYFDFFHNDFLFFLRNLKWKWMPVFFLTKLRPILSCMFYYGKARPRALVLPFRGYLAAYKTYKSLSATQ